MTDVALNAITLIALAMIGSIATVAVLTPHYDKSLLQMIGLSTIAVACIGRFYVRLTTESPISAPPPEVLSALLGLAAYATGTAWRVWERLHGHRPERRSRPGRRGVAV